MSAHTEARDDVRIHGLVACHPDAAERPTDEFCIHVRDLPDEDAEVPVATVCTALHCVRLEDPRKVLEPGRWCTVYGTIDAVAPTIDAAGGSDRPPADDFVERRELFTVTVERLGPYPDERRDPWSEYAVDDGGFGFIELSAPLARRRSRRTTRSPLRTTTKLLDIHIAHYDLIRRSGLFEDDFGGGGGYVTGHGYANSVNTFIITDAMREWLRTTEAEVVICPVIQRRA